MAFKQKPNLSSFYGSAETQIPKTSPGPQRKNTGIYLTIGALVLGFIILVGVVFLFAGTSPSLFGKCVAVVEINQELTVESASDSLFYAGQPGSEDIANAIKDLDYREDVGAVVMIVNSPGGSLVATHEIYDAVANLSKPKVAYFREVAASGGYYISAPTDYIISDPGAITGSIGVIATFADMSGLFEKIGLNLTTVQSGTHKDIGSSAREMTEEEKVILQSIINEAFDEFKGIVLKHRGKKLNMMKFEEMLDGRIVSGKQAKAIGLVDALGTKKDAIKKAAELAGIEEEPRICKISTMPESNSLFNLQGALDSWIKSNSQTKISYVYPGLNS